MPKKKGKKSHISFHLSIKRRLSVDISPLIPTTLMQWCFSHTKQYNIPGVQMPCMECGQKTPSLGSISENIFPRSHYESLINYSLCPFRDWNSHWKPSMDQTFLDTLFKRPCSISRMECGYIEMCSLKARILLF